MSNKLVFNPFTGRLDFVGTGGTPGTLTIPEVTSDPVNPQTGDVWILESGAVGSPGLAMGVLGLTYSQEEIASSKLSVKMDNGSIKRVELT